MTVFGSGLQIHHLCKSNQNPVRLDPNQILPFQNISNPYPNPLSIQGESRAEIGLSSAITTLLLFCVYTVLTLYTFCIYWSGLNLYCALVWDSISTKSVHRLFVCQNFVKLPSPMIGYSTLLVFCCVTPIVLGETKTTQLRKQGVAVSRLQDWIVCPAISWM